MGTFRGGSVKEIILGVGAKGARQAGIDLRWFATQGYGAAKAATDLSGALGKFGGAVGKVWSVLRQAAYIIPGLGISGLLGGIATAFAEVYGAMSDDGQFTGSGERGAGAIAAGFGKINEELVKQKTFLDDLTPAMHQYALSLGLASEKALTLEQREQGLWAALHGGTTNLEAARARIKELKEARLKAAFENPLAALGREFGGGSMAPAKAWEELTNQLELARKQERQFMIRAGLIEDKNNEVADDLEGIDKPKPKRRSGAKAISPYDLSVEEGREDAMDRAARRIQDSFAAAERRKKEQEKKAAEEKRLKWLEDYRASFGRYQANHDANRQDIEEELQRQREESYNKGKRLGSEKGYFALIGETDLNKIRGIKDAIREGIIDPISVAGQSLSDLQMGFAEAGAAAIIEGKSFKQASNEILKQLAKRATAQALFESAAALASLAIFDAPSALMHAKAAAAYGLVAVTTGIGAAATGGLRADSSGSSGGGTAQASRRPAASTHSASGASGAVVYNYYVNYNGFRADTRGHEELIRMINSGASRGGIARIDSRMIDRRTA